MTFPIYTSLSFGFLMPATARRQKKKHPQNPSGSWGCLFVVGVGKLDDLKTFRT
jgi:hypothetical protein